MYEPLVCSSDRGIETYTFSVYWPTLAAPGLRQWRPLSVWQFGLEGKIPSRSVRHTRTPRHPGPQPGSGPGGPGDIVTVTVTSTRACRRVLISVADRGPARPGTSRGAAGTSRGAHTIGQPGSRGSGSGSVFLMPWPVGKLEPSLTCVETRLSPGRLFTEPLSSSPKLLASSRLFHGDFTFGLFGLGFTELADRLLFGIITSVITSLLPKITVPLLLFITIIMGSLLPIITGPIIGINGFIIAYH